jgi:addiction module HigA family antidote
LKPLAVSQYHLAKKIGVLARRINEIVHGQRRISADTGLRLARFFGTSERFWIILQARYDLEAERTGSAAHSTGSAPQRRQLAAARRTASPVAGWPASRLRIILPVLVGPWNGSWTGAGGIPGVQCIVSERKEPSVQAGRPAGWPFGRPGRLSATASALSARPRMASGQRTPRPPRAGPRRRKAGLRR